MPNRRDGEIEELRKLILNIHTNSEKEWERLERNREMKYLEKRQEIFSYTKFLACNDGILTEAIKNDTQFKLQERRRIVLPPLEDDPEFLPLLTFKWNFNTRKGERGFFLDLAKDSSQILSLRFEEGNGTGRGDHDYLHMQINNRIDDADGPYSLNWLPDHHPHLLLRTKNHPNSPIVLLLYLLGSLYGFQGFTEKVIKGIHEKYENEMKSFLPN